MFMERDTYSVFGVVHCINTILIYTLSINYDYTYYRVVGTCCAFCLVFVDWHNCGDSLYS